MTQRSPDRKVLLRLAVLRLAEVLGNVSQACRQAGLDRTSFYKWRRRWRDQGLAGLADQPSAHKSHPHMTKRGVEERVARLAADHPERSCGWLARALKSEGVPISPTTIRRILRRRNRPPTGV